MGTAAAEAFMRRAGELGLWKERGRARDFGRIGADDRALAGHVKQCVGV
jgi:hypothetical protein